jgi:serine protease Do
VEAQIYVEEEDRMAATEPELTSADSELRARPGCIFKIVVILVIIAFGSLSLPELSYIFTDRLAFMNQNRSLQLDPIVVRSKNAVVYVEGIDVSRTLHVAVHQGTGFNIESHGKIVTNKHVVDSAAEIIISFPGGGRYIAHSYQEVAGFDLAVIELEGDHLPVLNLETATQAQSGDLVTLVGNPLGFVQIAQRGPVIGYRVSGSSQLPMLEIDVPTNPGSSGSPVLNQQGRVIGIIFASFTCEVGGQDHKGGLAIPAQALAGSMDGRK